MVIVDTGFWVALMDTSDKHHQRAVEVLCCLKEQLITTVEVLTEVSHLLLNKAGSFVMLRFILSIEEGLSQVVSPSVNGLTRQHALMNKYRNLPMDLADASLVCLAEELGHGRILSADKRDFKTYKWKERKPFQNLMVEIQADKQKEAKRN
jgi:uncharacterized protein